MITQPRARIFNHALTAVDERERESGNTPPSGEAQATKFSFVYRVAHQDLSFSCVEISYVYSCLITLYFVTYLSIESGDPSYYTRNGQKRTIYG